MYNDRNALIVGIDNYPTSPLRGCAADAREIAGLLEKNEDGSKNFNTTVLTNPGSRAALKTALVKLFWKESDLALLYFSGHGAEDYFDYHIVTPDAMPNDLGLPMSQLLSIVNQSKAKNKIIILDCCCAAGMGTCKPASGMTMSLREGVTILSSSRQGEKSAEQNNRGLFTSLLIEAFKGAAADFSGKISPGAIYAYIDRALAPGQQRPVFKTNISAFISIRHVIPPVPAEIEQCLLDFFPTTESRDYFLNPADKDKKGIAFTENNRVHFSLTGNTSRLGRLKLLQYAGLVVPFFETGQRPQPANPTGCRLTALGEFYQRQLVKRTAERILPG